MAAFYSCLRGKNSDCGIMASGSADATAAHEPSDAAEECPGKKKSKFQTFKNFFAKKKRKEAAAPVGESGLKSSQSSDDVNTPEPTPCATEKDSDSGSKINMGNKALSHDSVFASDSPSSETNEALGASQDSIHGKVKSLQLQLKQAIRLGSPPAAVSARKGEDAGTLSEDDGLPCSPPEYTTLHTVLATSSQRSSGVVQRTSSLSLEGTDSDDDQLSYGASSRPGTPQASVPVDFSQPASSLSCLDSSAAHHRIAVKAKACAKRKPASREMLQSKKRDLRERVLLRDTEDKLRAIRTCTEEEENEADVSEVVEEVDEAREESQPSPAVHNEDLEASSQSQRASTTSGASAETSEEEEEEEEERFPDKDHIPDSKIPESSWEKPVTLELQADDFLLDAGCEVVSEEQGSLLEEVLSSLKGPLTSGLVLEPEDKAEQMEVEHVLDNQARNDTPDVLDSTDQALTLKEHITPASDSLSESDEDLQEVEEAPEQHEEPEEQEFTEEASFEEDQQVSKGEAEKEEYKNEDEDEEDLDDTKYLQEDLDEEIETRKEAVEEVGVELEDEEKVEDNRNEEQERGTEEDVEEVKDVEAEQEEEVVVEEHKQEDADEPEAEEENETEDEAHPFETEEQHEVRKDMSTEVESIHELEQSVEDDLVSTETVSQPEDVPTQGSIEQPSFVVTTSLDLSLPSRASNIPKQAEEEDEPENLQEEANEQRDNLEGLQEESSESPQLADDHQEIQEPSTDKHQPNAAESRPRFTIAPAWQRSLSSGSAKEPSLDVAVSTAEEEPVFKESLSTDQPFEAVKAERPSSPVLTQSVPSLPIQREICQANEDVTPENPFGVRLRKTAILHRYASEGESSTTGSTTEPEPAETHKAPILDQLARKPALPKKPDQLVDGVVKPKRTSDVAVGKVPVESSEPPSWISVARQKQKIFSSLEESPEKKEEFNKKGSLPDLSSPVTKDQLKPVASPVKVSCSLEISKPALVEKENKRTISHPTPAPLSQDEPPWLALAKKKAKAWSEMPQIVQ
ncbi:LOW QUALITY PROTEIN: capping protein inhibiting regulator of actin dynamics [Colossoma macropomum]|uniref:LOW QUALITY PROTEIN: capping protein inhibiting regulator of actin dynamics n=1 Tax=Colossoma macropomum TaxID=42526 RepID=UPI001864B892|nr:LOW QUALITY PROTEIN: capping protein inhibiting regulator of actin dynamics [Colossoma macropomum]